MRDEDTLLYLCCTQEMPADRLEKILVIGQQGAIDWSQVFSLACNHGVAPLVYQQLQAAREKGLIIPDEVAKQFKQASYQNLIAKQARYRVLLDALNYLNSNGLDAMVVKGMALDILVYDELWYTSSNDIDIVLRPQRNGHPHAGLREVQEALFRLGIEFEFCTHHDVNLNGALPIDFEEIWRNATCTDFYGQSLYLMAPEDMLLAVCINSCRKRYFRLRSLCDMAEIVKRFPALDWAQFAASAIKYQCNNIVYSALAVMQGTVGSPLPEGMLDRLAFGGMRRRITDSMIQYLLRNVPLSSLSYYEGYDFIGRKAGWSLLLPYTTYHLQQMNSKIHEALTTSRPRAY
jgi:hypothetical protein